MKHSIGQTVHLGPVDRFRVTTMDDIWSLEFYRGTRVVTCDLSTKQAEFLRSMLDEPNDD